jgi:hypothetical protein
MILHRFTLSTVTRLFCAAALFWVVGCKSGGAPAVASPTASGAQQTTTTTSTAPSAAPSQAAPSADSKAVKPPAAESGKTANAAKKTANTAPVAASKAPRATKAPAAAAPSGKAPAAADKKPTFKLTTTATTLSVGAKGTASVTIAALNGYKWNKEYPAKLLFKAAPKNIKLGKSEFKQMAGDFKVGDKKTDIAVSMQAKAAGKETITGVLKFSICNETACIIEKADVALAVSVQP